MGLLEDSYNIITLGGDGDAREARRDYVYYRDAYDKYYKRYQDLIERRTAALTSIGVEMDVAISQLERGNMLLAEIGSASVDYKIHATPNVSAYSTVLKSKSFILNYRGSIGNATATGMVSTSAAAGLWCVVSTTGIASTGTAIGTLSGVAATNATLASLGGGSLASGGLGMAGGTLALSGLALLPISYVLYDGYRRRADAYHRANDEVFREIKRIKRESGHIEKQIAELDLYFKNCARWRCALQLRIDDAELLIREGNRENAVAHITTASGQFISNFTLTS